MGLSTGLATAARKLKQNLEAAQNESQTKEALLTFATDVEEAAEKANQALSQLAQDGD